MERIMLNFIQGMLGWLAYGVIMFFGVIIHELGHLITGILQGFKFVSITAGPFGICKNDKNKLEFYFVKNLSLLGSALTVPIHQNEDNAKKFARVILGGPLASLLIGGISYSLFMILSPLWYSELMGMFGGFSILLGIMSLAPMRFGAFYTDGARWFRLKQKKTKPIEVATLNLAAALLGNDKNVARVNPDDFNFLIHSDDLVARVNGHYYRCLYYRDGGDDGDYQKAKKEFNELNVLWSIKKVYLDELNQSIKEQK